MTDHRKTLLMNRVRTALEQLQLEGVGYIDLEHTGEIYYKIDDDLFLIEVKDNDKG